MDRFERQVVLPGFGAAAQQKLGESKILVIGAGGLGCPILLYLAAAGVGEIGVVDGDVVSLSNLNRQVLFGVEDVGKSKAELAATILYEKFPNQHVKAISNFITTENALSIISEYDLVIDGSDNFPTRYLVNDACFLMKKPLVFGAIYQHEGQVAVFDASGENPVTYRDLYPEVPQAFEVPNCNEAGVLGALPSIIGSMMALECIKFITGFAEPLIGKMLIFNSLDYSSYTMQINANPKALNLLPKDEDDFRSKDYQAECGMGAEIEWQNALDFLKNRSGSVLVDVREAHEEPKFDWLDSLQLPLSKFTIGMNQIRPFEEAIVFCQSGVRSQKAVSELQKHFPDKKFYSVRGGLNAFKAPSNTQKANG